MKHTSGSDWVRVRGPASLSNLGPGFDAIGLCLAGIFDIVEARLSSKPGVRIVSIQGDGGTLPRDADRNTASVAADHVLQQADSRLGLEMRIFKHIPLGSGIGGSAASAAAGAWAANALLGEPFSKAELVDAVLKGESIASGSEHGDNALPALFGGVVLVNASNPRNYRIIGVRKPLHIGIFLPDIQIMTQEARSILPDHVPFRDAVENSADFGVLVSSIYEGDWPAFGRMIMADRLVEPVRATLIPCFSEVRRAAVKDGSAYGCAITGSGPAMFAPTAGPAEARMTVNSMVEAALAYGIEARGITSAVDHNGVSVIIPDAEQEDAG